MTDQVTPEARVPFGYYSVTAPHIDGGGMGNYHRRMTQGGEDVEIVRESQPSATFSFTFVSMNRDGPQGNISGEDEAMEYAERAMSWFEHTGYNYLSPLGLVVVNVQNFASRSLLVVDETSRRWGFDVEIRYTHYEARNDSAIDYTTIIHSKGGT
ncbi:MAG: hypothetical protein LBJ11_09100 [Oscillospiraceae bacterium]|nr:hypothetical protein [Oscillospiraceae bacterium]